MRKLSWNIVLADSRNAESLRAVRIPKIVVTVFIVVVLAGLAGFGRLVYMSSNYALAIYKADAERRANEELRRKIDNLGKLVDQETETIARLAVYEDNARLKYGMDPISSDVRKAGVGGAPSNEDVLYASIHDPLVIRAESLRLQATALHYQAALQESTFQQVAEKVRKLHKRWAERPAIWPANGRLTSGFGYRTHPISGVRQLHEGIDIANAQWTPIYAPANGRVKDVRFSATGFGNTVLLTHNNGEYVTLFAHMQKAAVVRGQAVKRGDVIGYMGSTGRSTGNHLHYEVHHNGRPVDPMAFIVAIDQIVD